MLLSHSQLVLQLVAKHFIISGILLQHADLGHQIVNYLLVVIRIVFELIPHFKDGIPVALLKVGNSAVAIRHSLFKRAQLLD